MKEAKKLNLFYVHIPFCKKKCTYCYYYSQFLRNENQLDDYIKALEKEIKIKSKLIEGKKFDSLYIGGGSPDLLSPLQLRKFFKILKDNLNYDSFKETIIELNPYFVTKKKLSLLKENNINRISFGIQTTNKKILKIINRGIKNKDISNLLIYAKNLKFKINLDFILGLPYQKLDVLNSDIDFFEKIEPTSSFWCPLRIGTKEMVKANNKKILALDLIKDMQNLLRKRLRNYNELIPEYFTKEKSMPHYLGNVWSSKSLIGIGASAFSRYGNLIVKNVNNADLYVDLINKGKSPFMIKYFMDKKEKASLCIFERLKYDKKVSLYYVDKLFKIDSLKIFRKEFNELVGKGDVRLENKCLYLTKEGYEAGKFINKILGNKFSAVVDSVFNFSYLLGSLSKTYETLLQFNSKDTDNFSYFLDDENIKCIFRRK